MKTVRTFIVALAESKRVQATIVTAIMTIANRYAAVLDETTVNQIIVLIASLVVGDSLRPTDPKKVSTP